MAFYGTCVKIDGKECALTLRGHTNGYYICVFEREKASIEDIEDINWENPELTEKKNDCILPEGYGYEIDTISYSSVTRSYSVELKVLTQYLGDVIDYVNQVEELNARVSELESSVSAMTTEVAQKSETIETLTATNASLNEQLISTTKVEADAEISNLKENI